MAESLFYKVLLSQNLTYRKKDWSLGIKSKALAAWPGGKTAYTSPRSLQAFLYTKWVNGEERCRLYERTFRGGVS